MRKVQVIRKVHERPNDSILELSCGHLHTVTPHQQVSAPHPLVVGATYPCEYCILEQPAFPGTPMKQRPGDQPLPIHNNEPFCHDMVVKLVEGIWPHQKQISIDLLARKELGITRYGRALQPKNGRDFLLDLYEELLDASAYAQGCQAEGLISVTEYIAVVRLMKRIRDIMDRRRTNVEARTAEPEQ